MGLTQSIEILTTTPLKVKSFQTSGATLDDGQDPRPSASKTIDFSLRKHHSSDTDPFLSRPLFHQKKI